MLHNLNLFLLSFGALQGVLLAIVLFRNRRKHRSAIFLTAFLGVVGVQLTFKVISKSWLFSEVNFLYQSSYFLPFLAGPALYFFVRSRVTEVQFRVKDLLHMVPFLLGTGYMLAIATYGYIYTTPVDRSIVAAFPKASLQLLSLAMYSWWSFRLLEKFPANVVRRALTQFVAVVGVCEVLIIVAIAVLYVYYGRIPDIRLVFIALTLMIYWISYKVISQPEVFLPAGVVLIPLRVENSTKYAHSGLKSEEAERIAGLLRTTMVQQRLYLNPSLSIDSLGASLNISRHHLSQVLNEKFQQTYFDFINGYRLEEASVRLTNPKFKHYTIAAVAQDSGFSSVSNFNDVFKRRFGTTPSRFRDQHTGKMSA